MISQTPLYNIALPEVEGEPFPSVNSSVRISCHERPNQLVIWRSNSSQFRTACRTSRLACSRVAELKLLSGVPSSLSRLSSARSSIDIVWTVCGARWTGNLLALMVPLRELLSSAMMENGSAISRFHCTDSPSCHREHWKEGGDIAIMPVQEGEAQLNRPNT
jgi:hypothetical protein